VRDLLLALGREANVPVVIDPSVPSGEKFRLRGNLPPRPLPELFNYLTPPARLEWRWVGNSIFVTTTPEFQLFWGESEVPRVTVPAAAKEQRSQNAQDELKQKSAPAGKAAEPPARNSDKGKTPEKSNPKNKKD
jgi:hypothetical protein